MLWRGMGLYGWLEVKEQTKWPILLMESTGPHRALEMRYLQQIVGVLRGMGPYGLRAVLERIRLRIRRMESPGPHQLLEML
jgi:hypothetical protein